ncbi:MFS transporter [Gordonia jinghuaiqii]|uniref:MFS transporter n=1 Tax=Gordonia jinghuaiqii TaxID=2758710 RepID=A0A7D7QHP8_9ACTN|nr:MFS transporter [Gordonia jinghuaiqii]QMT01524.1 MFS transporter [Gordonia jinghuaiqii]
MEKRAAVSGTAGSALEFFDFAIYGALAASLFPDLFFSDLGSSGALLASFATFGVGFLARPFGAIVFGHLGDRIGRRPVLYITLALMGGASALIGLLPTYGGVMIATLLVGLRFLQGFSLGGEYTGNQLMAMEHADKTRRGLLGACVGIGGPISQVAANLTLAVLTAVLTEQQWESWGWRIPFISSIAIVAVAAYIRLKLTETPAFEAQRANDDAVVDKEKGADSRGLRILKTHRAQIIKLALLWCGPSLCYYLAAVYGLSLLTKQGGLASGTTFVILLVANAFTIPACIAGGYLSDRLGRKRIILVGLVGASIGVTLFFALALSQAVVAIAAALALTMGSILFATGAQPALFAEQFPTKSRFSGSALAFTLANLAFSAPAPLIATALADAAGTRAVLWLALASLVVSLIALTTIRDRAGIDLTTYVDDDQVAGAANESQVLDGTRG